MGNDLKWALFAFLVIVNVFAALVLSDFLFHTLAALHVKLVFAFHDVQTSTGLPLVNGFKGIILIVFFTFLMDIVRQQMSKSKIFTSL